jgi:hypothetical protein
MQQRNREAIIPMPPSGPSRRFFLVVALIMTLRRGRRRLAACSQC